MKTKKQKTAKPLKLKTLTYSRLKNLGDYENERIELTVEVAPGSDGQRELKLAKRKVMAQLEMLPKKFKSVRRHPFTCTCDNCCLSADFDPNF